MSEALRLLLAQVDDVPGEQMAAFMQAAEDLGVRNLQVVPSLTKKGRPGYMVWLDVPAALEDTAARLLGSELGTWGYRVLAAEHHHFDIRRHTTTLHLTVGDETHTFTLGTKTIAQGAATLRVKAEHDDLAAICQALRARGHAIAQPVLKAAVETALHLAEDKGQITIRL